MKTLGFSNIFITNILIFAMLFINFSQLRLFHLPVGFGELTLLLLGMIVYLQLQDIKKKELIISLYKNMIVRFWLIYFLLLVFSFFWIAEYSNIYSSINSIMHDVLAYFFIFYIIVLFSILKFYNKIDYNKTMQNLIFVIIFTHIIFLLIFLLSGKLLVQVEGFRVIIDRFSGLSNNPNQLGLVFTVFPFLLYHFYIVKKNKLNKNLFYILIFLTFVIGYVISSKSLYLAWFATLLTIVIFETIYRKVKFAVIILTSFILILGGVIYYFDLINLVLYFNGSGSATHRFELIANAFILLEQSPIIGFGPGAHINSIQNTEIYWEVHNTFLDISLQVGVLGVLLYFLLLFKIGINLIKVNKYYLFFGLLSLIIFSSFHFVIRQPIFWFYLFYFYQAGKNK